jgi:cholest-4-en-3-one 26-monooxygenase
MTVGRGRLDILAPETHIDPWPLYTRLREDTPLYFDEVCGVWIVSRYDDICKISKMPKIFSSEQGNRPNLPGDESFINKDGRMHAMRRSLVNARFGPRAITKMEDHIRDAVVDLLDSVPDEPFDFVEHVAAPLPMRIIGEMCGIPSEYHDDVRQWMDVFMTGGNGPDFVTMEVNEAFMNFGALHFQLIDERRENPKDDLLTLWLNAEIDGKPYNDDQLLFEHTMMMIGGSETARNAITGGLEQLILHPEQAAFLAENPHVIENAFEEMTRWVTPFISMSRTATCDYDGLYGAPIREGEEVMFLYPAANREPGKFPDPHTFDVQRDFTTAKPIAFGYGPHFCLGARLARMEGKVLFEELLKRWSDLRITGEPVWAVSSFVRGITQLDMTRRRTEWSSRAALASK